MTSGNFCFYLQNRLIQSSQTGGQPYSDSPFSIPWVKSPARWQRLFREHASTFAHTFWALQWQECVAYIRDRLRNIAQCLKIFFSSKMFEEVGRVIREQGYNSFCRGGIIS